MMIFHSLKHGNWWGVLDTLGHALHLPGRIQDRICDRYDASLGVYAFAPTSSTANIGDVRVSLKRRPRR